MKSKREDIHLIARHSNWSNVGIECTLKQEVYSNRNDWSKFLTTTFLSLGVGFALAGIIFFFAYNWNSISGFAKLGLIQLMILSLVGGALLLKSDSVYQKFILLAAAVLVGVLYAVYGQIYQTGANAYDFFLAWTMSILVWVLISNFAPLWLLFIVLVNTTYLLYTQQVASGWTNEFALLLLFVFNVLALLISLLGHKVLPTIKPPKWFTTILTLLVAYLSVMGIVIGIFAGYDVSLSMLLGVSLLLYAGGVIYGLQHRDVFYIGLILLCVLVILAAILIHISDEFAMFLFISIFVVICVTLIIMYLLKLHRKWKH